MSVSAFIGSRVVIAPSIPPMGRRVLVVESSSRPQKKATAHHRKTRPKKTAPWDKNRGPTVYPPLPDMPPEWTLVTDKEEEEEEEVSVAAAV